MSLLAASYTSRVVFLSQPEMVFGESLPELVVLIGKKRGFAAGLDLSIVADIDSIINIL